MHSHCLQQRQSVSRLEFPKCFLWTIFFYFPWPFVCWSRLAVLTISLATQSCSRSCKHWTLHRVKVSSVSRLQSLITISSSCHKNVKKYWVERRHKSWTRVQFGDSCQVNGPVNTKYSFQSLYFVYSVSLGILSPGLTNLHILTFTGLQMAVRVKFYCVLICQVSGTLRILFLRQIRNLLSSLSQGQVRRAKAECSDEFYFILSR